MFAPQLRLSVLSAITVIGSATTVFAGDGFLPPVVAALPTQFDAAGSKPATLDEPRVFSSGPVLTPNQQAPMEIPSAAEMPDVDDKPVPLPTPPPEEPPTPPPAAFSETRPFASPPPHVLTPEPAIVPAAPAPATVMAPAPVMAPTIQQYYQPAQNSVVYTTTQSMSRNWASLESLIWWTSKTDTPVLASTSPAGVASTQAGVLGNNTQVLFGGDEIFGDATAGFRVRGGHFFNECDGGGITAEFFLLGSRGHDFHASSDGDTVIARPFFNTNINQQDSQLISSPGQYRGSLDINAETRMYSVGGFLWGELYLDRDCGCSCGEGCDGGGCTAFDTCHRRNPDETQIGIKFGPRFSHLDDTILVDENTVNLNSGGNFRILDSFKTENSFLGGELGLRARRVRGKFDMELGLQLAIGGTHQELDVGGSTTHTSGQGIITTTDDGILAVASNSGSWDRNRFSLIPGLEVAIGRDFGKGWRWTVGYNLIYWTNVLRASEQIDTNIDPSQFQINQGSATTPGVLWNESDYLAHGISFGLERRW